jgi:hypothetical protein
VTGHLEYRLHARFAPDAPGVLVAVALSERTARRLGNALYLIAHEVWYRVRARQPGRRAYRPPRHSIRRLRIAGTIEARSS